MADVTLRPGGSVTYTLTGRDENDNDAFIEDAIVALDPRLSEVRNPDGLSGTITSNGQAGQDMAMDVTADAALGPDVAPVKGSALISVSAAQATRVQITFGAPS
jgi:hypothetical protein